MVFGAKKKKNFVPPETPGKHTGVDDFHLKKLMHPTLQYVKISYVWNCYEWHGWRRLSFSITVMGNTVFVWILNQWIIRAGQTSHFLEYCATFSARKLISVQTKYSTVYSIVSVVAFLYEANDLLKDDDAPILYFLQNKCIYFRYSIYLLYGKEVAFV